jgi:ubiquinone/menaquinone biosynthesis C-methylase UbiE
MNESRANIRTDGHSNEDLRWYARWRPGIWSKIIGDTFTRLGWDNLKGKRVLEIGYGDGRMAVMFARHGARYVGFEIDDCKLATARRTAEQAGVLGLTEFRVGDFMRLEETFDYVFVKSVLYHIREEQTYRTWLRKINFLLVPGGKFIALENGVGISVNRWIRQHLLRRNYVDNLLYCLRVEQMFCETFAKVDVQYFYILAHLTPYPPLFARLESCFVRPSAQSCFAAGLICEKR